MKPYLVCHPFAGGGASFYRVWQKQYRKQPGSLAILPLQLPGREELLHEEPFRDLSKAADALAPQVAERTAGRPVVLFGHCLGAMLAYEVACRLQNVPTVDLRHLIVSGSPGPWSDWRQLSGGLADDELVASVEELTGYQHEALAHPDLLDLLLPALRADVEMHASYRPDSIEPLRIPITALRGKDDHLVSASQAGGWRKATADEFRLRESPGGHMYLVESPEQVMTTATAVLAGPDS
ncbi:alpha/beta fold hydrolase [Micromonospora sp. NBC_01392]|uniref:thioesterase II family protein n=1 Tax=Micromonospora sp. NBC_01392 TaxID=2903588 RepID=UPI003255E53D